VGFTRPAADAFKRHHVGRVVGISALGRGTAAAKHAGLVTESLAMADSFARQLRSPILQSPSALDLAYQDVVRASPG
jgi:hypothetical protein